MLTGLDKGMLFPLDQCMASCVAGEVSFKSCHRIVETFPKDTEYGSTEVQHTFGKWLFSSVSWKKFVVLKVGKFKVLHRLLEYNVVIGPRTYHSGLL